MFKMPSLRKGEVKDKSIMHDIVQSPYILNADGKPQAAIKVDTLSQAAGEYSIEGWVSTLNENFNIDMQSSGEPLNAKYTSKVRDDVLQSMQAENPELLSQGFILTCEKDSVLNGELDLIFQFGSESEVLTFTLPNIHTFIDKTEFSTDVSVEDGTIDMVEDEKIPGFLSEAIWQTPDPLKAMAHIDSFGVIPQRSGLMAGWMVTQPGWQVWGIDSQGNFLKLENALRYQREDIVGLFRDKFGQRTVDAGFVASWPYPLSMQDTLALVAYHPESQFAFEMFSLQPEEVPNDPEGYARWAFNVPTPAEKFNERLNNWEGELIETLLAERDEAFAEEEKAPDIMTLGSSPEYPDVSLIIPLYSRWDFVEHQLLAFARDADLLETTEIIYVVDDPRILTAISNEVENLHQLYKVPFKVVWGHRNRGFSGANNLGVSVSRGRQVLLLNSDAFPISPGWVGHMSSLLDENPRYGLLGARLLNPEGGLQHAGMVFFYSESWQVWLNKHPLAGLAPELDDVPEGADIVDKPAVTGACVIMQRSLYDELGGLNEGYLIGDFEDSDLCLKVLSEGYQIGYVPGVSLVHLERQSFSALGDTSFRTLVVRFNAWRHTKRWGEQIQSVMQSFS